MNHLKIAVVLGLIAITVIAGIYYIDTTTNYFEIMEEPKPKTPITYIEFEPRVWFDDSSNKDYTISVDGYYQNGQTNFETYTEIFQGKVRTLQYPAQIVYMEYDNQPKLPIFKISYWQESKKNISEDGGAWTLKRHHSEYPMNYNAVFFSNATETIHIVVEELNDGITIDTSSVKKNSRSISITEGTTLLGNEKVKYKSMEMNMTGLMPEFEEDLFFLRTQTIWFEINVTDSCLFTSDYYLCHNINSRLNELEKRVEVLENKK